MCLKLLENIEMYIKMFQSNGEPPFEVHHTLTILFGNYHQEVNVLSEDVIKYLLKFVEQLLQFCTAMQISLQTSYILAAMFQICRIMARRISSKCFIISYDDDAEKRSERRFQQYTAFRIYIQRQNEKQKFRLQIQQKNRITSMGYWQNDGASWLALQAADTAKIRKAVALGFLPQWRTVQPQNLTALLFDWRTQSLGSPSALIVYSSSCTLRPAMHR